MVAVAVAPAIAPGMAYASPNSTSIACGTPLTSSEIKSVVAWSDTSTITGADDVARFDDEVERDRQITEILVHHRDWRGLFPVGLDAVERVTVVPLQHNPTSFVDPRFAHAFSPELLRRFLVNLHNQFLGLPTDPQWTRYFDLTHQCDGSPARVALAGYNAHFNVDVAYSLSAVHCRFHDAPDYLKITAFVALQGQLIIDRTKAAYGVDIGPLGKAVIAASPSVGTVAFADGLALQDPQLAAAAAAEIGVVWRATDAALPVLTGRSRA
jgi:hypothetical protein